MSTVHRSLDALENAIRASWCVWTSDPVDQARWSESNPACGQCASTALVVQDLLGGDLLMADVQAKDGTPAGVHYWNRLAGGIELDLTREQFRDGETISESREVTRPADVTRGRLPGQYHLLSSRVTRRLTDDVDNGSRRVTVKAVCIHRDGRVLLCRNDRGQWELPGGRPEIGELFQETVARELQEETGLEVTVGQVLGVRGFEVIAEQWVDVVAYTCQAPVNEMLTASDEHVTVAFVDPRAIADDELPGVYRELIARSEVAYTVR
ncbi:MAG TPA: NUDIX domain-containing protein [Solirubrobacteraceae bacterium]|jgi:ADP-ribose pyrophosphatase YjhB (NUDIX family)